MTTSKTSKPVIEPVITAEHEMEARAAEAITLAYLQEAALVKVFVPKGLGFEPALTATLNGLRFQAPVGVVSELPAPIAELISQRVDAQIASDAKGGKRV